jgi:hypothetical protein
MVRKLYEIKMTAYIMAEDENELRDRAEYGGLSFNCDECDPQVTAVKSDMDISEGWLSAIPFEADDDRVVGEIVEAHNKQKEGPRLIKKRVLEQENEHQKNSRI